MHRPISPSVNDDLELAVKLRRLLNRHIGEISSIEPRLSPADLMAALFLAVRLGAGEIVALEPSLSSALAPLWREARPGVLQPERENGVNLQEVRLSPTEKIESAAQPTDGAITILYGLSGRAQCGEVADAFNRFPDAILLPVFGRSIALWSATSCVVADRSSAVLAEAALDSLTAVFNDSSFDPLKLSELCERLRLRANSPESGVTYSTDETTLALNAKIEALQTELEHLRHSSAQHLRAIAILNAAYEERSDV